MYAGHVMAGTPERGATPLALQHGERDPSSELTFRLKAFGFMLAETMESTGRDMSSVLDRSARSSTQYDKHPWLPSLPPQLRFTRDFNRS